MSNKSMNKLQEMLNRNNPALEKSNDMVAAKVVPMEHPVQHVRLWLIKNRVSLKISVQVERVLVAYMRDEVKESFMKSEVNRLLNRKFFTE